MLMNLTHSGMADYILVNVAVILLTLFLWSKRFS